jgi:hypothetical protein
MENSLRKRENLLAAVKNSFITYWIFVPLTQCTFLGQRWGTFPYGIQYHFIDIPRQPSTGLLVTAVIGILKNLHMH